MYEIFFIASAWSSWITTVGVYAIDGLFIGICLHLSGQFEIISAKLHEITESGRKIILNLTLMFLVYKFGNNFK